MTTTAPARIDEAHPLLPVLRAGVQDASQALSRLLRQQVQPESTLWSDATQLQGALGLTGTVVTSFQTSGGLRGALALVLDEQTASSFAQALTRSTIVDAMALSALSEVGNIVASAFLNGAARVVGAACLPSVPTLVHDDPGELLRVFGSETVFVVVMRAPAGAVCVVFQPST